MTTNSVLSNYVDCTTTVDTSNIAWPVSSCCNAISVDEAYVTNSIQKALEKKTPDVPAETKSILQHDGKNIKITTYKDGFKQTTKTLLPDIKDVTTHQDRVVIVEFADGTKEKAVLHPDDKFSIDQGISICITKKLVGSSSIYNKLITYAMDVMDKNRKAEAKKMKEQEQRAAKAKRIAEKKVARKAAKREESINTLAEIISRAITLADSKTKNTHKDTK